MELELLTELELTTEEDDFALELLTATELELAMDEEDFALELLTATELELFTELLLTVIAALELTALELLTMVRLELEITTAVEELNSPITDDDDDTADVSAKELEEPTDGEEICAAQAGSALQESA